MAMADKDIFDLARIHPQLLDAVDDLRLDRVMEQRVDHDEAGARLDHPRVPAVVADPVEVVEDLARLLIPLGTRRHVFRARSRGWSDQPVDTIGAPATRGCVAAGRRNDADPRKQAGIIQAGRPLCRRQMHIHRISCGIDRRGSAGHSEPGCQNKSHVKPQFHCTSLPHVARPRDFVIVPSIAL